MSRNRWKTKAQRDADKMLRTNGFEFVSCNGDHFKYRKGSRTLTITGKCNPMMMRRLIKEHELEV